jgi:DNA repair exonuclease SbcCD ATPase subunit
VDLDTVASELYGLTPDEFTAARNQLAKTVDGQLGAAIKALRKPTLAAWLANLLVRSDPDGVNALTELGDKLRAAHLSADGATLRALTPQRHTLVKQLVASATAEARKLGRTATPAVVDRLTETLDAALIDPGAAQLLRNGQLISALRHVGFGVVDETGEPAKLAPMRPRTVRSKPAAKTAKPVKPHQSGAERALQMRRAQLQARAAEVEQEYAATERERAEAESVLDAHQHHAADLQATIDRLTEELDHARHQLKTTQRDTARLERTLNRAMRTAALAQRRRDAQLQRLANFDA